MKFIIHNLIVLLFFATFFVGFVSAETTPAYNVGTTDCPYTLDQIKTKVDQFESNPDSYIESTDSKIWNCITCNIEDLTTFISDKNNIPDDDKLFDCGGITMTTCVGNKFNEYRKYVTNKSQFTSPGTCPISNNPDNMLAFNAAFRQRLLANGLADDQNADIADIEKIDIRNRSQGECGGMSQLCCANPREAKWFRIPHWKPLGVDVFGALIDGVQFLIDKTEVVFRAFTWTNELGSPCTQGFPNFTDDPSRPAGNKSICRCGSFIPLKLADRCELIENEFEREKCNGCMHKGFYTGIGCIYTDPENFIKYTVFQYGLGFAGIVSLLCIILGSIQIQLSGNNPEKIKKAQEQITSCIVGLMLVIFSVLILKIIGVDILRIPNFK